MNIRQFAIDYAMRFIGDWYQWGGSSPDGFDCSGFACEVLQAVGKIHRKEDLTAQEIWERFALQRVPSPYAGCFVFYTSASDPSRVIHIELCINEVLSVGASGGGSNTLTKADAIRDQAFIKVRPFGMRANIAGYIDVFEGVGL